MRTNAEVKAFNFQDLTQKSDFDTSSEETVFDFLKKPVGNQYLHIVRILVPSEISVTPQISAQFARPYLRSTE